MGIIMGAKYGKRGPNKTIIVQAKIRQPYLSGKNTAAIFYPQVPKGQSKAIPT